VDVNKTNHDGFSSLINAAKAGHDHIVDALLKRQEVNVNHVDQYGFTALISASREGNIINK
jgi:ankyrin repeat protein